jgi:hypothetical protein
VEERKKKRTSADKRYRPSKSRNSAKGKGKKRREEKKKERRRRKTRLPLPAHEGSGVCYSEGGRPDCRYQPTKGQESATARKEDQTAATSPRRVRSLQEREQVPEVIHHTI